VRQDVGRHRDQEQHQPQLKKRAQVDALERLGVLVGDLARQGVPGRNTEIENWSELPITIR